MSEADGTSHQDAARWRLLMMTARLLRRFMVEPGMVTQSDLEALDAAIAVVDPLNETAP